MRIIGLTGGIACGKSTISLTLKSLGATIIDGDQLSRCLLYTSRDCLRPVCLWTLLPHHYARARFEGIRQIGIQPPQLFLRHAVFLRQRPPVLAGLAVAQV